MQFLRDSSMQGATFILAVLVMLLQFPEHITWLFPFSILFLSLLYFGHKYSPEKNQAIEVSKTNWQNIIGSFTRFIKNQLIPTLTILTIFVSLFFTIHGVLERTSKFTKVTNDNLSTVEKIEFLITDDTFSINLHSIVSEVILRDALFRIKPEIVFSKDVNGYLNSQIRFDVSTDYNDSGIDPQNRIFEPNGSFITSQMYGEPEKIFSLKREQTLFFKTNLGFNKDGTIRIHVVNLPKTSSSSKKEEFLTLIISYNSDSERFYGLTTP